MYIIYNQYLRYVYSDMYMYIQICICIFRYVYVYSDMYMYILNEGSIHYL